ncbi:MAG TPA: fumarylacetoacetate hydrolase family protein, partial [Paludibacteraceae bacterium]|nr:fumarylacetoacetate hydrolase family protein [Paludibacteraceae bacterium]
VHYETEVVLRICRLGKNIAEKFADRYYDAVALGVDFTARDLQNRQKAIGGPWEISKAFDGSAVISEFVPLETFSNPKALNFNLLLNGKEVQRGNTSQMIFDFNALIAYISRFFTLKMGDLIYTGTPSGVGKVSINDHLQGFLENKLMFDFYVK